MITPATSSESNLLILVSSLRMKSYLLNTFFSLCRPLKHKCKYSITLIFVLSCSSLTPEHNGIIVICTAILVHALAVQQSVKMRMINCNKLLNPM